MRAWFYRWTAFALLLLAAFAVVPPGLDRAGTAVLGIAFMALAMSPGASRASRREATFELPGFEGVALEAETQTADLLERLQGYGAAGDRAASSP